MLAQPLSKIREMGKAGLNSECPIYKIALLGDGAVGKTSLRHRFMRNGFDDGYSMTIGADFATKTLEVDGKQIKFQIWDLAGQPQFSSIRPIYYRGSVGALLVYDISVPKSFHNALNWVTELWKNNGKGPVPFVLLGNKFDLRNKFPDAISSDQGKSLAEQLSEKTLEEGFEIPYLETSAKTGRNVTQAFSLLGANVSNFIAQLIGS
ncbi:MAG: GTP-binding protein [Candidatus Heimdallarchaeota archaeon]